MTDHKTRPGKTPATRSATRGVDRPWRPTKPIGLARALLKAGYGTRRQTEEMVRQGRIRVGNNRVTDPQQMVDAGADLFLDDELLVRLEMRYFALHKPTRVFCGESDSTERKQIDVFFPENVPGLAAAGRMDSKTSGLILISNDNAWNNLITTTHGLEQEYRIQVEGELSDVELSVMTAGVHLPNLGLFRPQAVRIVEIMNRHTVLNMTVGEGKIRQVKRMLSSLRHQVTLVRRVRIGDIRLGDLSVGGYRELSSPEITSIREINTGLKRKANRPGG